MKDNEEVKMDALTKEQIEYVNLKREMGNMFKDFRSKKYREEMVFTCYCPELVNNEVLRDNAYVSTRYFYLCMEILQGKHTEFLKELIEATEKRDKDQSNS